MSTPLPALPAGSGDTGPYPTDWSLFEEGDPVPGEPDSWSRIINMWNRKAEALNTALNSYTSMGEITGQGYKIRYLNDNTKAAHELTSLIQQELYRMGSTAQDWHTALTTLRSRARTAHTQATEAADTMADLATKIACYEADLATLEPGSLTHIDVQHQLDIFRQRYDDAAQVLTAQRAIVTGIANEHREYEADLKERYVLKKVRDLASVARGNLGLPTGSSPYSGGYSDGTGIFELSAEATLGHPPVSYENLATLQAKTADSPEALSQYLAALMLLSPAELAEYARRYPGIARLPLEVTGDGVANAQLVRHWWDTDNPKASQGLDEAQRKALITTMSGFVGNLDGIPYTDRDQANRVLLDYYLSHPDFEKNSFLTPTARQTLKLIKTRLEDERDGVPRGLINLDLSHMAPGSRPGAGFRDVPYDTESSDDVLTSLAFGDLDQAEAVTVFNPGMLNYPLTSLDPHNGDMAGMGQDMYEDQREEYAHQQKRTGQDTSHAVLINLNYVTPQSGDVLAMGDAKRAAQRNANQVDALNVLGDNQREVYLWSHSYGSTTTGETIKEVGSPVSAIYNVGSAGYDDHVPLGNSSLAHDAADLEHLAKDDQGRPQMYSTLADADKIARIGQKTSGRVDPRDFYNSFEVSSEESADGQYSAVEGHPVHPQEGVGYNSPGSNSYRSGILITTGQAEQIPDTEIRYREGLSDQQKEMKKREEDMRHYRSY